MCFNIEYEDSNCVFTFCMFSYAILSTVCYSKKNGISVKTMLDADSDSRYCYCIQSTEFVASSSQIFN